MNKIGVQLTVVLFTLLCISSITAAETGDYYTVQLYVKGASSEMSGSQAVHINHWSRFDLSFGRDWSRINTAHDVAPDIPPALDGDLPGTPELLASVIVQVLERDVDGLTARVTIHTGSPAFADLVDGGDWVYATEVDTAFFTAGGTYEFYLQEPLSKNHYKATVTIDQSDETSPANYSTFEPDRGVADLKFTYRVKRGNDDTPGADVDLHDTFVRATSDDCEVTFENVVHVDTDDSCYHYVTVEIEDIEFTSAERLSGLLLIKRMTVFGSDAAIDAGSFTADRMIVDRFKRRIRLANGRPVEILIPPEENRNLPFPATEVFRITGTW